ncbi:hypothetical protein QOL99_17185 [Deinococcus sp. MIMF12]|uniref:DUF1795 domain-containing protein n=1 Tax=Deinococcus rhizophilus TaxID=3049544 RepID=A0ABT7JLP5_9DEIO|nr:hypothetical protein [Deinococcus rhizophilus]MDL2345866.1 hypothetical protein [Deinococcus rhizophilus]
MKRALLLSLAVGLPAAAAQTLKALDDKRLPFTVQLPQDWYGFQAEDGAQGVSVISAQKPPATLMRFLFLPKGGKAADISTEFRNFEAGVKGSGGTLRLIGGKNSAYGGVRGSERVYSLRHSGGELRMRVWFGSGAQNLYSFQVTDSAARFARSDALFKRVLGTVRFR